jgi:hypothetical protein
MIIAAVFSNPAGRSRSALAMNAILATRLAPSRQRSWTSHGIAVSAISQTSTEHFAQSLASIPGRYRKQTGRHGYSARITA